MCPHQTPANESCRDSLLRSDRLMLVYLLYSNLEDVWKISGCDRKSPPVTTTTTPKRDTHSHLLTHTHTHYGRLTTEVRIQGQVDARNLRFLL